MKRLLSLLFLLATAAASAAPPPGHPPPGHSPPGHSPPVQVMDPLMPDNLLKCSFPSAMLVGHAALVAP